MNADKAGDHDAARKIANAIKSGGYDAPAVETPPVQKSQERESNWYDPIRAGLQGLTLGFSDEIGAGIAAIPAAIATGTSPIEAYRSMQQSVSDEQNAYREQNPIKAGILEAGGALATGGAGLSRLAAKTAGKPIASRIAGNMAIGAAEGGVAGAGFADAGNRAEGATVGAVIGAPLGAVGGEFARSIQKKTAVKDEVGKLLKNKSTDRRVAKYVINGAGKVQKDPIARDAIKQGVDEGVVATIKGASNADKQAMNRMLSVMARGRENARYSAQNRASDVIGKNLVSRIKVISQANREAGAAIKGVALKLKGRPADFTKPINDLMHGLDEYGISLVRGDNGLIKPDFTESLFRKNPAARRLISNLIDEMQKPGGVDGFRAHWLKKMIDDQVVYGKSKTGLGGEAERLVKSFRRNLDQALDDQFPEYKKVNDIYSETKGILDSVQDAAGSKIDILGRNNDKALGTLSRSLLSNIRSRGNLINSLDDLDVAAKKYGGKYEDDILTQVLFADELDRLFGASAKTSLQGDMLKASAGKAARGSIKDMAIDAGIDAIDKARGINEENAIKSLRQLLSRMTPEESGKAITVP